MSNNDAGSLPAIKGSWEDLLDQAQMLATNQNDKAIPIYEKLVTRLTAMAANLRAASDGRLDRILRIAASDLQSYFAMRGRYDESISIIQLLQEFDAENAVAWQHREGEMLLMAGRIDEGIAILRSMAESREGLGLWARIASEYMEVDRSDEAETVLDQMRAMVDEKWHADDQSSDANEDRAQVLTLQAALSFHRRQWQEGIDAYQQAMALDGLQARSPQFAYTRLIRAGQDEAALPLLVKDQEHPTRVHLWRGISLHNRGDKSAAEREWSVAAKAKKMETETFEYLLANYYLGDKEGAALGAVLEAIRDSEGSDWTVFYLAGLGWAVRNEMTSAISNFRLSRLQGRALAYGANLPKHLWYFCQTMLDEEKLAQIGEYFDQPASVSVSLETEPTDP
ncbi:MAG: hypothetical protein HC802_00390 [Caldilineaceae bacterium]|nr:hypothetical protein [Caldilineaceae bacterium]